MDTQEEINRVTEEAIKRCANYANQEWVQEAIAVCVPLIKGFIGREFTIDPLYDRIQKNVSAETHNLSALGPLMRQFWAMGLIEPVGDPLTNRQKTRESVRKEAHKKPQRVWRAL